MRNSEDFAQRLVFRRRRVDLERAKPAAKGDMLLWRDWLIAEKDHFVYVQRGPKPGNSCIVQLFAEVDPMNFSPDRRR